MRISKRLIKEVQDIERQRGSKVYSTEEIKGAILWIQKPIWKDGNFYSKKYKSICLCFNGENEFGNEPWVVHRLCLEHIFPEYANYEKPNFIKRIFMKIL